MLRSGRPAGRDGISFGWFAPWKLAYEGLNEPETPSPTSEASPKNLSSKALTRTRPAGLEPATAGLEIPCSIQLSYGRINT